MVVQRRAGRVDPLGGARRGHMRCPGVAESPGQAPVPGGLGRVGRRTRSQGGVERLALGRELECLDRLRVELVRRTEPAVLLDDEAAGDRGLQGCRRGTPAGRVAAEQLRAGDGPAGGREEPDDPGCVARHRLESGARELLERVGEPHAVDLACGSRQVERDQGVASGTLADRAQHVVGKPLLVLDATSRSISAEVERPERQPDDRLLLAQPRHELAGRVASVELVGLVRDDEADRQPAAEAQQRSTKSRVAGSASWMSSRTRTTTPPPAARSSPPTSASTTRRPPGPAR